MRHRVAQASGSRIQRCGARIGFHITAQDPFWLEVHEAVVATAARFEAKLVPVGGTEQADGLSHAEQAALADEYLAEELDALIVRTLPEQLIVQLAVAGLPVICLSESTVHHPLVASRQGLWQGASAIGQLFAQRLQSQGQLLCIGGLAEAIADNGRRPLDSLRNALSGYAGITITHIPCDFSSDRAIPQIEAGLRRLERRIDALVGLTDDLALAARKCGMALGLIGPETLVGGLTGDSVALAAVADGSLTATLELSKADLADRAVRLAMRAADGLRIPSSFASELRLVTADNVREVGMQKLIALAEMPRRLADESRQREQNQVAQLEIAAAISRRVSSLLDRQECVRELGQLIRETYDYDEVRLFVRPSGDGPLRLLPSDGASSAEVAIALADPGVAADVLVRDEPIFLADAQHSACYRPDPAWPETRARAILPIHFGGQIAGVLDLHSRSRTRHAREELRGLQALADHVGVALHNCELYAEALRARKQAEDADRVKSRLLANVSHELRAPLNAILGYSVAALAVPNPYNVELPVALRRDLEQIYGSGEHLMRLINDLLDLSRAEVDALDLFPETIVPNEFLGGVFQSTARHANRHPGVTWRLELAPRLPLIQADPVRLRQVLDNLLSNARASTAAGEIVLGADIEPPFLHVWVHDTGEGIAEDQQACIFEPFVSGQRSDKRRKGIGLGLTITRRLVALHHGTLRLESELGRGSTFHVRIPLPQLEHATSGQYHVLAKPVGCQTILGTIETLQPAMYEGNVLIVDDDPASRAFYSGLVSKAFPACTTTTADNGAEALHILQEQLEPPTLVILDLAMPQVDGFGVLEWLRADRRTRHVPVLVVSGRLLSLDDVRRLDYARVQYQTKDLLSPGEALTVLQRVAACDAQLPQPTSGVVKRALVYLHEQYGGSPARHDVARAVGVSENYLSQIFHRELGLSPSNYLSRLRIHKPKSCCPRHRRA